MGQHRDILPGSPSAILAIFTEIVRERFRPGNDLPWEWDGSVTPKQGALNTAASPRKILIESAFSELSEVRNFRPAIYVDKGPTQTGKIVTGNFADQHLPTGKRTFFAQSRIPITISCESARKGESGTLADTVWFYLLGALEPICATFDFHELTPPQLGGTVQIEKDKPGWVTQIMFAVTTNIRWTTTPIGPVLQQIKTNISITPPAAPATPEPAPPADPLPDSPYPDSPGFPGRNTIEIVTSDGDRIVTTT